MEIRVQGIFIYFEIVEDAPEGTKNGIRVKVHDQDTNTWNTVMERHLPDDGRYTHVIEINNKHTVIIRDYASNWIVGESITTVVNTKPITVEDM